MWSEHLASLSAPFWFPDSVLLCAMLVTPRRHWWLLILTTWPIRLGLSAALGTSGGWFFPYAIANDSAKALLAAWWLEHVLHPPVRLNTLRQFVVFLGIAALAVPLMSALVAVPVLRLLGTPIWSGFYTLFLRDSLAQAIITPVLLGWSTKDFRGADWPSKEDLLLFGGLAVMSGNVFFVRHATVSPLAVYALVPFLIWAGARLFPFAAGNVVVLVVFAAMLSATRHAGVFFGGPASQVVLSTQLFTFLLSIPLFSASLLNSEREQRTQDFRSLRDAAPLSVLTTSNLGHNHDGTESGQVERHRIFDEIAHLNRVASIGRMAASVAHELTQPLAAILSNAQAAERFASASAPNLEEVRGALEEIIEDDRRARSIVHNMRQIFTKHALSAHLVDLNEIVRGTGHLAWHDALLRGVRLQWKLSREPIWIEGDEIPLQQVILNLLTNGMDAMRHLPTEQRIVTIETAVSEVNGFGVVAVADSGTGIPPQDVPKLFTPFFTTKCDGLGLGLSICHSIVYALGGRIKAENRQSRGAVFEVMLPLSSAAQIRNGRSSAA
jgi:signal transduction histidine kinase